MQKPESNYIILESVSDRNESKYLYIIQMKDRNVIKIGRASDADVRITDISVSRNHAEVKFVNGSYYVSDFSSKFGTLVRVKNNFSVIPNGMHLALQLKKNFLTFRMKKTFISFITCYKPFNQKYLNYNDIFSKDELGENEEIYEIEITDKVSKYDSCDSFNNSNSVNKISNKNSDEMRYSNELIEENKHFESNSDGDQFILLDNGKSQSERNSVDKPYINKISKEGNNNLITKSNLHNNPAIQLNININLCDSGKIISISNSNKIENNQNIINEDLKNKVKTFVGNVFNYKSNHKFYQNYDKVIENEMKNDRENWHNSRVCNSSRNMVPKLSLENKINNVLSNNAHET